MPEGVAVCAVAVFNIRLAVNVLPAPTTLGAAITSVVATGPAVITRLPVDVLKFASLAYVAVTVYAPALGRVTCAANPPEASACAAVTVASVVAAPPAEGVAVTTTFPVGVPVELLCCVNRTVSVNATPATWFVAALRFVVVVLSTAAPITNKGLEGGAAL